ncbi:hypothetical protein SDC9_129931 [bioreactor metagenome]|uniref:Uncharacterized protein n=1 Tax=bioreactor metagenome TaxID=1076179 RepID=A0A645D119_9ZZZZ
MVVRRVARVHVKALRLGFRAVEITDEHTDITATADGSGAVADVHRRIDAHLAGDAAGVIVCNRNRTDVVGAKNACAVNQHASDAARV